MVDRRSVGRNGLVMKAWAPPLRARSREAESACAVSTSTGIDRVAGSPRIPASTPQPSITGSPMSRITRSGGCERTADRPAPPSASHENSPMPSHDALIRRQMTGESSMTRI